MNFLKGNSLAYFFIVFGLVALLILGVDAYGTNSPPNLGHTFSEIQAPIPCQTDNFLQYNLSGWRCKSYSPADFLNIQSGGPVQDFLVKYIGDHQLEPTNWAAVVTSKNNGNVGFFTTSTKDSLPRERLDVHGDIRVNGDICSDVNGCLSNVPQLQLQYAWEYSATQGNPQNMPHVFCYVSSIKELSGSSSYYCTIAENSGSWTLSTSITIEGECKAICFDVA